MTTSSLIPCIGCQRHVRASEPECPFCGAAVDDTSLARVVPVPSQRLSRGAVVAFAAAFLSSACTQQRPPVPAPPPSNEPADMSAIYGGPPSPAPLPTPVDAGSPAQPDVQVVDVVVAHPTPTPPVTPEPVRPPHPVLHPSAPTVRYGAPPRP